MTFGQWLKAKRNNEALSQKEFAEKIGIHYISFNHFESDKRVPSNRTIRKIATALNVEVSVIRNLIKGE